MYGLGGDSDKGLPLRNASRLPYNAERRAPSAERRALDCAAAAGATPPAITA